MGVDETREKSRANWAEMASGWQKHNDYIWQVSRPVGEHMIAQLEPQPGQTILEIACGPGDTGFVAAKLIGEDGLLIATDFAPEMVEVARGRAAALDITNAQFRVMDAERMDLADDSIDGILCRWGFMLMLDPVAALKECRRVLRDGGRLSFSVWGSPQDNEWVTVYGMTMARMGHPPQGDPFGPGGMFSMSDHGRITEMVRDAGFTDSKIEEIDVVWTYEDFDAAWRFANELAGAIARTLKELPSEEVERFKTNLKEALESYRDGEGYAIPGRALDVVAS